MQHTVSRLDDLPGFAMAPGVTGRPLFGDRSMLNLVELEPGAIVAEHDHPHEQLTVILDGGMVLVVDGVELHLGPRDALAIPSGTRHAGIADATGCTVLDVFTPIREDMRARLAAAQAG